jgi:hypothetical protein
MIRIVASFEQELIVHSTTARKKAVALIALPVPKDRSPIPSHICLVGDNTKFCGDIEIGKVSARFVRRQAWSAPHIRAADWLS